MNPLPISPVPVRYGVAIIILMCAVAFICKIAARAALLPL